MKLKVYTVNYSKKKRGRGSKKNQEKYSIFAAAAYAKDKRGYLDKYNMKSWKVDKDLSKSWGTVFVNDKTGEVVLGGRGTTSWNPFSKTGDFWANFSIATGFPSSRMKKYDKLNNQINKKYGKNPVYTGHSQAGFMAARLAKKNNGTAYVYNSASPPKTDPLDLLMKNHIESYTTNKISKGKVDVVSLIPKYKDRTSVDTKVKDTHSIANFLPDASTYVGEGRGKNKGKIRCKKCKKWYAKSYYQTHLKTKSHNK
mgnify:CR=1 FL=1